MSVAVDMEQMQAFIAEFKRRKMEHFGKGDRKRRALQFTSNALQFWIAGIEYGIDLVLEGKVPNEKTR